MIRRLLITGFRPFGGAPSNPSWEAVRLLPDEIDGWAVKKACLPVEFGRAGETLVRLAESFHASMVISVGLAAGRTAVTPEMIAVNLRDARIPDNAGRQPAGERIDPDGPDGIFSDLPVRAMTDGLTAAGFPAAVSRSAGTFVCNDVFYQLMRRFGRSAVRCGFVHVPPEDVLSPERCAEALKVCVRACGAGLEGWTQGGEK